ncbi:MULTISPECIES: TraR/DksA C4-type zinc finger protein [unclassified Bacillus (in: firmicutes)]|uniref:TraR/DksA C4-type zinc finger protein n=1 Tax=unclassified Bacillus (in: firmicutes) TaxID=185979 RepID=UPI001BECDCAA|nr:MULTISPECIES: TraR/DksA C4-type zinc finger protein [unclassified Bacillus (in: firmicutes)]MBT2640378.1 TraR/DksA C4-type zinc finger protein [Bacillus sp. ISL-39]MBT2662288.1 TraR/DksA C4-type zinc finger protein [Bacillus sp. ISL-45]
MLTNDQLTQLKQTLIDEKETLISQIDNNEEEGYLEGSQREATGELSSYDNHPADSGTELFERSKNLALDEHFDGQMEKVENALKAIEDGTYGKCAECGKEIPFERLEAVPYTLYCVEHSTEQTLSNDRPVEEEVLEYTHEADFDRRQNEEMADNRNSFNDVAEFGTSETPSDLTGDHEDYNKLYIDNEKERGFTEDFESFSATDIEGDDRHVFQSDSEEEYEEMLDEADMESELGDIPYKEGDSYINDDKKKNNE